MISVLRCCTLQVDILPTTTKNLLTRSVTERILIWLFKSFLHTPCRIKCAYEFTHWHFADALTSLFQNWFLLFLKNEYFLFWLGIGHMIVFGRFCIWKLSIIIWSPLVKEYTAVTTIDSRVYLSWKILASLGYIYG